jgi:hypothetical protein
MNTKLIRYYDKIFEFGRVDPLAEPDKVYDFFDFLLEYNFELAGEIWEYLLESKKTALQSSQVIISLVDKVLILFSQKSEQKTAKLLNENTVIRTAVYQLSADADNEFNLSVICNILLSSKIESSEEFLKALQKNTAMSGGFAGAMRQIVDNVIDSLRIKAAEKNTPVKMQKKLAALLMNYISKTKGAHKAILTQKIKEVT